MHVAQVHHNAQVIEGCNEMQDALGLICNEMQMA
jgi:hypothetical protein